MKILGIDTILHDVCVAITHKDQKTLANINKKTVMNSSKLFKLFDLHKDQVGEAINKALKKAGVSLNQIDLIAVNNFGSFFSNVSIGVIAAQVLAKVFQKPLIGVNHQEAHYFSARLERKSHDFSYPLLILSSSGGHSSFVEVENSQPEFRSLFSIEGMKMKKNKPNFRGIGAVYGYVANLLKISGPIGGVSILNKYAKKGNNDRFRFDERIKGFDIKKLDFLLIEKAVSSVVKRENRKGQLKFQFICDVAASFEYSLARLISDGLVKLAKKEKAKEINLVGGIAANDILAKILSQKCRQSNLGFKRPVRKSYCTDNAAMIAALGFQKYSQLSLRKKQELKKRSVGLISNLRLEEVALKQRLKNNVW